MRKQAFGILTMLSLLLVFTAASVHAQSKRSRINIPFSFTVGEKTLPAGEYTLEPNHWNSASVWLMQSKNGRDAVLFSTNSTWTSKTQEETQLIFNNYDGQYFLSQIWTAGDNTGRRLQATHQERQLARGGIQREKVIVNLSGNE